MARGVFSLSKKGGGNKNRKRIGCLVVLLGILVFLALIMPPGFWWVVLGGVLVCTGFCIMCGT